jgi:hypothetical protein
MTISPKHGDVRLASGADLPYFVVGGRYADTSFTKLLEADPANGPFERYDEAVDVWRASSMQHIDEAFVRYLIVQADSPEAAAEHAEEPPEQRSVQSA